MTNNPTGKQQEEKPRYEVIANYPGNIFLEVGRIVVARTVHLEAFYSSYPHIFKPLISTPPTPSTDLIEQSYHIYKVHENEKVSSFLMAILRELDTDEIESLSESLIARLPPPELIEGEAREILQRLVDLKILKDELDYVEKENQDQPLVNRYAEYVSGKAKAWKDAFKFLEKSKAASSNPVEVKEEKYIVNAEDIKRWFQLLVGTSEEAALHNYYDTVTERKEDEGREESKLPDHCDWPQCYHEINQLREELTSEREWSAKLYEALKEMKMHLNLNEYTSAIHVHVTTLIGEYNQRQK